MHTATRLHYMDNLRALAMLAGVLFHAALAYSPLARPVFPTADRDGAAVVDVLAWWLHLFRMPLFFVVAGFFAAFLVRRDGDGGMLRNRMLRIGVPFVLCWPAVHLALKALTLQAATTAVHPSPLLRFLGGLLATGEGLPQMLPGTGHLWFLWYLLILYVLAWALRSLEPRWLAARLRAMPPLLLLGAMPLLLVPALATVPSPHPAPESVFPQFWALSYYGAFFAFGYLAHGAPAMFDRLRRPAPWLLAGSVLLYAAWFRMMDAAAQGAPTNAMPADAGWVLAVPAAYIGAWMTCVCLVAGRRWLDRPGRWLRPLADASYWTYVVHLPVLFAIQYRLMDLPLPWWTKFAIAVAATLALCLLSFRLLVRPSVLGRVFDGGRSRASRYAAASVRPNANESIDSTP